MESQGHKASTYGKKFEQKVLSYLVSMGFKVISYKKFNENNWRKRYGNKVLVTNYRFNSIYNGHYNRTEFMLFYAYKIGTNKYSILKFPIECKIQHVSGTVDEKFPFLLLNCIHRPETSVMILLAGKGARSGAIDFLKHGYKKYINPDLLKNKYIKVYTFTQFKQWANKKFNG